ncbi:exostosin-2 isoform X2 [Adelges cooleyi]|uniref:exostosin-2 isoform X2 n=1 Tax=Adelges cooleyi TaxID=133065 RepID=UPI00217F8F1F|nr:exostosin-2 isoform X2 [Adelges cooleyi]
MYIRLSCCRLLRHRKLIYISIFVSILLSLIYVVIIPLVLKFLQKPQTNTHTERQYVVPRNSPVFQTVAHCSFHDCFNIYRCGHKLNGDFKVYIYPASKYVDSDGIPVGGKMSREYYSILSAIVNSHYYTDHPEEACVFVSSIDTLNQNRFRVKETSQALAMLPYWNDGENHIILNMVPGAAPNYKTIVDLSIGKAMVAGAGFDTWTYRTSFDISIGIYSETASQLSHNYSLTHRPTFITTVQTNLHSDFITHLKSIEQKRSILRVVEQCTDDIHNRSIVCHGNVTYEYTYILRDSIFCLILPGPRLMDTTLSDALATGCIPVIAINHVVLPFFEVIDWKRAVILWSETELDNLLDVVSGIPLDRRKEMSSQCRWLYHTYLSSLQKITMTTLKILSQRLHPHSASFYEDWNLRPNPESARSPLFLPYMSDSSGFTAVILSYDRVSSLFKLIRMLKGAPSLQKILVIWNNQFKSPPLSVWPKTEIPIKIIQTAANKLSNRFYPYREIETEAVLSLDDDILMLTIDEIEFGYQVWKEFPDQIVGFPSRSHVWNNNTKTWKYESEWKNEISMVLTGAAFYHKFWNHAYTYNMPGKIKKIVDDNMNCEDIAMNFLIANTTNKAPIKVTPKKKFKCPQCTNTEMLSADEGHMATRTWCINQFAEIYGRMPLKLVEYRADPVLYKDLFPKKLKRYNNVGDL